MEVASPQLTLIVGCGSCADTVSHLNDSQMIQGWLAKMGITHGSQYEIRFVNGGAGSLFYNHTGAPDEQSGLKFLYHEVVSRPNLGQIIFVNHTTCQWYYAKVGALGFINNHVTIEGKMKGDLLNAKDLASKVLTNIRTRRNRGDSLASQFLLLRGQGAPKLKVKTFLQHGESLDEVKTQRRDKIFSPVLQ